MRLLTPAASSVPTDDVIAHTRQVFDSSAANEDDRVLLQVVADARNIDGTFHSVYKVNTGDFAQSGIGLFGRHRTHCRADAALLRALL